jgi:ATP-binding protein involved in chromosome partitioning
MVTTVAPPTHDEVMAALATVIDPELGADIVSLGMVPTVDITPDGVVTVGVKLTIRGCPLSRCIPASQA